MKRKQYKKSKTILERKSNKNIAKKTSKRQHKLILVNKKMSFGEIINRYPSASEILMNKGMHCIGCSMAVYETLEQGAIMHGINPDKLVEEINKKILKKK